MNTDVIKQYLVRLSFDLDNPAQRKFNEAIRVSSQAIQKFTSGMATDFVAAGSAVVGTLTAIATGVVAMGVETARSDLQMQLMARRMFQSLPAFREMTMALDALGVSAQDVIFGPPELRERYKTLIEDSRRVMGGIGGASFEQEMRKIRDVEFQFTRMRQEASLFVMAITKSLSKALTGDEEGILKKLKGWNEWLIQNIPQLADKYSGYLVPVLRDVKAIWEDMERIARVGMNSLLTFLGSLYGDPKLRDQNVSVMERTAIAVQHIADSTKSFFDHLKSAADFVDRHPWAQQIIGGAFIGGAIGTVIPGAGTIAGAGIGAATGAVNYGIDQLRGSTIYRDYQSQSMSKLQWQKYAYQLAQKYKLDPGTFMAMIERESAWNPNALNPKSTATGFGQFLRKNWNMYGMNAQDPFQNMEMSAHYLSDLTRQYGSTSEALRHYGPSPAEQPAYQDFIVRRSGDYNAAAQSGAFSVGTVNIYAQTNDPAEHARKFIEETNRLKSQRQQVQSNQVYVTGGN